MRSAKIKAISYYLPADVLDNKKLNQEFPEWSVDKISSKTGIYERHISDKDEFVSDMAVTVCEKLFKEHNIKPEEIDFILLCTQSPDYLLPTTACIVQDRLKIPTSAGALDFNLGCSGYIYGLALAKGLTTGNIASNILLITSETYSKFIHPKDKSNRTIFGDGASATLISVDGYADILDFELGTDGSGAANLIVQNSGARKHKEKIVDITDDFGNIRNENHLYMNGSEIFNFTSRAVPSLIENTLLKHKLSLTDIDYFVFHQANRFMLEHLRKKIKIDEDKFCIALQSCGNTVSSTIPIALKDTNVKGTVLLAGFGVGYSWGACILKIN